MPKRKAKADLPHKLCAGCGRPFAWRKRWEKVWDEVRYCSERCRRERRPTGKRADEPPAIRRP
ncbi:DUF2256 domain-containing protein [Methylopila turkensis]|uniref:DUF2256 domain-containing protein n=1 Tax=Methylopila turkensis TaxID=1437816 RepID=A0A9W6N606_9HYPH|nr:DUF2256 domain-containing protein [Methylopila turkensis]GLK78807.1 hypothetical protein GCM10008174_05480 [Methylopila turkensis]